MITGLLFLSTNFNSFWVCFEIVLTSSKCWSSASPHSLLYDTCISYLVVNRDLIHSQNFVRYFFIIIYRYKQNPSSYITLQQCRGVSSFVSLSHLSLIGFSLHFSGKVVNLGESMVVCGAGPTPSKTAHEQ